MSVDRIVTVPFGSEVSTHFSTDSVAEVWIADVLVDLSSLGNPAFNVSIEAEMQSETGSVPTMTLRYGGTPGQADGTVAATVIGYGGAWTTSMATSARLNLRGPQRYKLCMNSSEVPPSKVGEFTGGALYFLITYTDASTTTVNLSYSQIVSLAAAQGLSGTTSATLDISSIVSLASKVGKTITSVYGTVPPPVGTWATSNPAGIDHTRSTFSLKLLAANLALVGTKDGSYSLLGPGMGIPVGVGQILTLQYNIVSLVSALLCEIYGAALTFMLAPGVPVRILRALRGGDDIWAAEMDASGAPAYAVTQAGDWSTVSGREAVQQKLDPPVLDHAGDYLVNPTYGAGLLAAVKAKGTRSRLDDISRRLRQQALADERVRAVSSVKVEPVTGTENGIKYTITVDLVADGQPMTFSQEVF